MHFPLCLLILFLTLDVMADGYSPTWPSSCTFTLYSREWPLAVAYASTTTPGSEKKCREQCSEDSSCGMYRWWRNYGWCVQYQTSLQLVSQVMGVKEGELIESHRQWNIGSKKCEELEYDHSHCLDYPVQHEKKYPDSKYEIVYVHTYSPNLTTSQCQALCSTYTLCRSVRYRVTSDHSYCWFYSTTITHLMDTGKQNEIITYTGPDTKTWVTYDRYCGERPYQPTTTG